MAPILDSSSDDEYDYCNVAARMKALEKQTKDKPRPPARPNPPPIEVPKKTPTVSVLEYPSVKDTGVNEPVKNGSVTSGSQYADSDDVESISDSASSHIDQDLAEVSTVDTEPRTLDTIEIVDSPLQVQTLNDTNVEDLDDSINDDTIVAVHIRWKSNKIECIQLNKYESLLKIFQKFADQENIPVNRILVSRRDMPIRPSDTPASLKLSIIDVLEGGIISAETSNGHGHDDDEDEEDICKIKAQVSAKKFVFFKLRKGEPFKKLKEHCATELDVPVEKIKFSFDGDHVSDSDTPETLDLDDEACIDVKILT